MKKRTLLRAALLAASGLAASGAALAQDPFPQRPLTMIVPFAAGNVTDTVARKLSEKLGEALKQPVVVDNKPGASGIVGMNAIIKAAPDGHTLGLSAIGPMALNPALYPKLPYKPASELTVVSLVYKGPLLVLVPQNSPIKNLAELVARAKKDGLDYASPGNGSSQHLTGELLRHATGAKLAHIPNRGSGQAASLLLGGHVPVMFESVSVAMPLIKSGQVRALAISSEQRLPVLPEVPTFAQAGYPSVVASGWLAVVVPVGVPAPVRERLSETIRQLMATPEMREAILQLGGTAESMTAEQSANFVRQDSQRWAELIKAAGITLE
jgi:tripartite-type tricarboxylate transporter receptor subunit TctC